MKQVFFLITVIFVCGASSPLLAGKRIPFLSPTATDVSGTAAVRGGDVMGDAIKRAHPDPAAVAQMESRSVARQELETFQRQGKVGRFAGGQSARGEK